jgi:Sulfatase-modifying factor enzyme 1/PEGA domain
VHRRLTLCALLLAALPARAADRTIVVLPLDITKTEGHMSAPGRASLEEELRDEAANALAGSGWTVMTGETTLKILTDSGIDPSKCVDGSCHLDTAKQMNVEKFISGGVQFFEGAYTASVRLIDTKSGNILASTRLEGKTVHELGKDFAAKAEKFFEKSGLLGTAEPLPAVPQAAGKGTLKVVTQPAGARVLIDGDEAGKSPLSKQVDPGTYVVSVELAGHAPVTRSVDVASGRAAVVNEKLMQAAGYIDISVIPKDARVSVDGAPAGAGKQGPFKVGRHTVRAESAGYKAAEVVADVDNGGTTPAQLSLEARPGKLLISVNVDADCSAGSARVQASASGVTKLEVSAGAAHVVCSREGYSDASADVDVAAGKALPVKLALAREMRPPEGKSRIESKSGLSFIAIPAAKFRFQGKDEVSIKAFSLGETAVTVAAYAKCVSAGTCTEALAVGFCNWKTERTDHPINCVDWNQATAFCKWIGGRLPTEEEREYVASGGSEGRTYPWGNEEPGARACWGGEGSDLGKGNRNGTCQVGSHGSGDSKWGLHDLAGNVWEWTSSDYDSSQKVLRGGSWIVDTPGSLRARYRSWLEPSSRSGNFGFRCGL